MQQLLTLSIFFNFYPRPPRGGRPINQLRQAFQVQFLSTPSARRATELDCNQLNTKEFLSTPSARRATTPIQQENLPLAISIHALREEGDQHNFRVAVPRMDFYPRPPRGGRPGSFA